MRLVYTASVRKFSITKLLMMVYDFLLRRSDDVSLEDYCQLYNLLGIYEFLCPSHTRKSSHIVYHCG